MLPIAILVAITVGTILVSYGFSKTFDFEGELARTSVVFEEAKLEDVNSIFYARLAQYQETTKSIQRMMYLMILVGGKHEDRLRRSKLLP